jgi:hypothetical protein
MRGRERLDLADHLALATGGQLGVEGQREPGGPR